MGLFSGKGLFFLLKLVKEVNGREECTVHSMQRHRELVWP